MTVTEERPAAESHKEVGTARRRKEDARLITGRTRWTDNIVLPGMLHLAMVRSPFARATITSIDTSEAKSAPGVLAVQANGHEVTTIEGLAEPGSLHAMQEAFHECHALQCGFCTPGMIMQSVDLLNNNPNPTEDEIRNGLEGNLCRCTGYHNIVRAVQTAAAAGAHAEQPDAEKVEA